MEHTSDLRKQRQEIMNQFLEAKAKLREVSKEKEKLEMENQSLADELEEKNIAVQNLFAYLQG